MNNKLNYYFNSKKINNLKITNILNDIANWRASLLAVWKFRLLTFKY